MFNVSHSDSGDVERSALRYSAPALKLKIRHTGLVHCLKVIIDHKDVLTGMTM